MGQFTNSIIRGAGYTIGRNLVNGTLGGGRRSYSSGRRNVGDDYRNKHINEILGKDIVEEYNDEHQISLNNIEYLKKNYTSKELTIIGVINFTMYLTLCFIVAQVYHPTLSGASVPLSLSIVLGWIPTWMIGRYLLKPLLFGQRRLDRYNAKYVELLSLHKQRLEILKSSMVLTKDQYGDEILSKFKRREVSIGLPMNPFIFFFGEPNGTEETTQNVTYIYGTSKRAGDWFRFQDDKLVDYSLK